MKHIGLSVLSVLVLVGCGHRELSDEEKARFAATLGSISSTTSTIQKTSRGGAPAPGPAHRNLSATSAMPTSPVTLLQTLAANTTGGKQDQNQAEIDSIMAKSLQQQDCKMPNPFPEDLAQKLAEGANPKNLKIEFALEGKKCPMNLSVKMAAAKGATSKEGTIEFSIDFKVNDDSLRDLMDIDSLTFKGTASYSLSGTKTSMSQSGSVDAEGTIHSKKEGDLPVYLSGSMDKSVTEDGGSATASVKFGITYEDFTAEIEVNSKADEEGEETTYLLNGVETDEEELAALIAGKFEAEDDKDKDKEEDTDPVADEPTDEEFTE